MSQATVIHLLQDIYPRGLTSREISIKLGISQGSVWAALRRIKKRNEVVWEEFHTFGSRGKKRYYYNDKPGDNSFTTL